jgi:hypothetical protein
VLRNKNHFWLIFDPNWGAHTRLSRWDLRRNIYFNYLRLGLRRAWDHTSSIEVRHFSFKTLYDSKINLFLGDAAYWSGGGYWEAPSTATLKECLSSSVEKFSS